jgi:hypothetical protein
MDYNTRSKTTSLIYEKINEDDFTIYKYQSDWADMERSEMLWTYTEMKRFK